MSFRGYDAFKCDDPADLELGRCEAALGPLCKGCGDELIRGRVCSACDAQAYQEERDDE